MANMMSRTLTKNADYLAAVAVIEKEFNEYKNRENRRVAQLKITIPNDLNDIYNKVSNLGKE